jgi:acyl-CoA thioesterase
MSNEIENLKQLGANEPIASFLGLKLLELSPGYAKVSMKMKSEYLNFNGKVYGGIIASVADQAFAYAGNSLIMPNVAAQFNIHYLAAVDSIDELFAVCHVLKNGKRICMMEIKVTNQKNELVALATGMTIPLAKT